MQRTALLSTSSIVKFALVLAAFGVSSAAMAQQALPPTAQPDRLRDQIPVPQVFVTPSADVTIPELRIEGAPEGAENVKFPLNSLTIEGAQAYDEAELSSIYAADIGQTIPLTRLYEIAAQITRKYRADGYIITQAVIPEQTIDSGNARILVVEGGLAQARARGDVDEKNVVLVNKMGNKLTVSDPLHSKDLERYLLLINDIPGLSARSIIGPSNIPGKADLDIIVTRKPYDFFLSADNYGSKYMGPLQLTAAAQFNNPFNLNDRLLTQFVTAPHEDEMYYSYMSYEIPLGSEGTTLALDGSYSDTAPGHDIKIFKPKGHSGVLGLTVKHPIIRGRYENLNSFIRLDYQNSGTNNALGVKTQDHLRSVRLGGTYEMLSHALGTSVNTASVQLSHGLNIFNASRKNDADMSRSGGNPQYTKLEAEISRLQRIDNGINLLVAAKGQKSSSPLLSAEEIGFGGMVMGYGRGYDPSEIAGDDGLAAKVELHWAPNMSATPLDGVQFYGFYDVGTVWDEDTSVSKNRRMSIASTGVGARMEIGPINAHATMAVPLTRRVSVYDDKDPRFFVSLSSSF